LTEKIAIISDRSSFISVTKGRKTRRRARAVPIEIIGSCGRIIAESFSPLNTDREREITSRKASLIPIEIISATARINTARNSIYCGSSERICTGSALLAPREIVPSGGTRTYA